ncbi:hypothetical protein BAC2_02131 [uncultured bacterium]|nr:hypothetical protein BAC2_02131 [uncultured bacterium]
MALNLKAALSGKFERCWAIGFTDFAFKYLCALLFGELKSLVINLCANALMPCRWIHHQP